MLQSLQLHGKDNDIILQIVKFTCIKFDVIEFVCQVTLKEDDVIQLMKMNTFNDLREYYVM